MILAEVVRVEASAGAPEMRLLDARSAGLNLSALRAQARAETATSGAPHVARSYCYPYALVAWHRGPVGVDIERIEACDEAFARSICTPSELAELADARDRDLYVTSLWCSKEALAKALGNAVAYDPRRLEAPSHWLAHQSGPWRAQPLSVVTQHTAWVCWAQPQPWLEHGVALGDQTENPPIRRNGR
jgi:phosphopantetheinyl transferase